MLNRDCLFMSGESGLTMKCVFRRERWMHTCSASELSLCENGKVRRALYPRENLNAVVLYADMNDKGLEWKNLETLESSSTKVWPSVNVLKRVFDRHVVMKECIDSGIVSHPVLQLEKRSFNEIDLRHPFVVKTGNTHRGENKYLVNSREDLEAIECTGTATVEPYFEGASVRALVVQGRVFGVRVDNDKSWIKNTSGAEISCVSLSQELTRHALDVTEHFGLDISGVDYVLDDNGFHFLEVNQFPGVAYISDEISECCERFFDAMMTKLES